MLEIVKKEFPKVSLKKFNIIIKPRRKADLDKIISDNTCLKKTIRWKPKYNNLKINGKKLY